MHVPVIQLFLSRWSDLGNLDLKNQHFSRQRVVEVQGNRVFILFDDLGAEHLTFIVPEIQ